VPRFTRSGRNAFRNKIPKHVLAPPMANLLLIEDDKRLCKSLKRALRDKDFMVELAYGGRVGLQKG